MKSVWRALIWKEWHEHKWKLVALTTILIALPAMTLLSEEPSVIFTAVTATMWFAVPMLSVFIGANSAARENSNRTMPFLQSMPTPMPLAAFVKLVFAILTVCISVALVIAFTYVVNIVGSQLNPTFRRGMDEDPFNFFDLGTNWYLSRLLLGTICGTSLVIWVAAVGANRSDEVRAGALGILAIVSYSFLLVVLAWKFVNVSLPFSEFPVWFKTLGTIGPCGPIVLMMLEKPETPGIPALVSSSPILLASMAFHGLLAACFIVRFGRVSQALRPSERTVSVVVGEWLAPPRRTRLGALMWKQFRESGPLALIAMCMSFAISAIFAIDAIYDVGAKWNQVVGLRWETLVLDWFRSMFVLWMFLGFFVAIVAGIGVFIEELRPGVDTFWRSRPINRDLWFWTKLGSGMGITVIAMLIPLVAAFLLAYTQDVDLFAPGPDFHVATIVLIQVVVFVAAALGMLLVRQAIYSAVFAIAVMAIVAFLIEYFYWDEVAPICLAIVALLATLLAWLAVRYDWSLRR